MIFEGVDLELWYTLFYSGLDFSLHLNMTMFLLYI